jgi:hypothetical protein
MPVLQAFLQSIDWLVVAAAALAAFVLTRAWFSPVLFGRLWQGEAPAAARAYVQEGIFGRLIAEFLWSCLTALVFFFAFRHRIIPVLFATAFPTRSFTPIEAFALFGCAIGLLVSIFSLVTSVGSRSAARAFADAGHNLLYYPLIAAVIAALAQIPAALNCVQRICF